MSFRLLRHILLLALLLAPLGRMAVAEAKAPPHHAMAMAASHCPGQPAPDRNGDGGMCADCTIACAATIPVPEAFVIPSTTIAVAAVAVSLPILSGIQPEAESPPPRLSS